MVQKLTSFSVGGNSFPVSFVASQNVTDGVEADIYEFIGDHSRDLAIVSVQPGHKTPLQRVMRGTKTIEGALVGKGTLTVQSADGAVKTYESPHQVTVEIGQLMQWQADGDTDLTFYEICEPPYEHGRFENLAEG